MLAPRFHPFPRLFIATLGAIALSFAVVLVIGAIMALVAFLGGQAVEKQIAQFFQNNLLVSNLLLYPPVLAWLWFCRRFFDRRAFVSLGLRASGFGGQFAGGIVGGFLTCAFIFGVLWLSGNLEIRGFSLALESGGWPHAILVLSGWALMMLCVGFMEEIAFRGYAFHNLYAWLGAPLAIGIQAAIFALIHLGNLAASGQSTPDAALAAWLAMPNIFLIGVFFALCYLKTGSLWFPIAFHASWNFFLGCVFSLPVSGLPIFQLFEIKVGGSIPLTGGAFGPEASLLLTPILLALIFAVSRAQNHPQAISDLESLRASTPAIAESTINEPQIEIEPKRENRFGTRMGARHAELDEQTRETLQLLNEAKTRRDSSPARSTPFPILGEIPVENAPAEIPVEVVAEENISTREKIAEPAPTPLAPKPSTPASDKPKPPAPRW